MGPMHCKFVIALNRTKNEEFENSAFDIVFKLGCGKNTETISYRIKRDQLV